MNNSKAHLSSKAKDKYFNYSSENGISENYKLRAICK
jgi:hypothetical protein